MSKHYVIGLGSGRCGTRSLAKILGLPHEARHLPWQFDQGRFERGLETIEKHGGDVGCYWLNYVEPLLDLYPDTKFVCLKRDREKTVRSWVRRMKGRSRFGVYVMFIPEDGRIRAPSMFPDYGKLEMAEAAGRYWDEYYRRAQILETKHPDSFRIYAMEETLNFRKHQARMLKFAGVNRSVKTSVRENQAGKVNNTEVANMLAELAAEVIWDNDLRAGARVTVKPEVQSRLAELAVEANISKTLGEELTMEFGRIQQ